MSNLKNKISNWIQCSLEDISEGENAIVDGPFGSNLKNSDYIADKVNGVPVLTTKNLEGDYSDDKVRFISKSKFETLKRSQVNPGDIIVAKIGSIGKNGIYPNGARTAIIPANLLKFTVSQQVNFQYVYFYINYYGLQKEIKAIATATAQPAFNVTKFRKLNIPLPPLAEQHRIVAKIEELFSELDKGIETLKTAQQQLKVYRQAVLKYAFEGKLTNPNVKEGELPEGWVKKSIEELSHVIGGIAFKSSDFLTSGKYQVIRMGNVRPGVIRFNESPVFLNEVEDRFLEKGLLRLNDVIITQTGTKGKRDYGFTALIKTDNLLLNQRIATIRCDSQLLPKYLLYFSWTDIFKNQFFANETGNVGQGNVGIRGITQSYIPLPNLHAQNKIVQEIESRLSVCDKIEESIEQGLQQAEALRQSILKKAFEGKLVSQDPNDEPASVLLERIKSERASFQPEKKTRTKKSKV